MILRLGFLWLCLSLVTSAARGQSVAFYQVSAILTKRCVKCHSGTGAPMGLDLTGNAAVLAGGWPEVVVQPGQADGLLLRRIRGQSVPRKPLDGPPFLSEARDRADRGVGHGRDDRRGADAVAAQEVPPPCPGEPVLWPHVETILQRSGIKCHSDNSKLAAPPESLHLTTLDMVLAGGERLVVLFGNPVMSGLWRHVSGLASPRMPHDGPPNLTDDQIRLIRDWIVQGAKHATGTPAPIPARRDQVAWGVDRRYCD